MKCPLSAIDMTPEDAVKAGMIKYCILDDKGQIILKRTHQYMYQVQGQLHITRRDVCFFVIWTPKGINIQTIYKDDQFWHDMEHKLDTFYMEHMLPIILKEHK